MDVMLTDLLKLLGIDITSSTKATAASKASTFRAALSFHVGEGGDQDNDCFEGAIIMPSSTAPDDVYTRASKNSREVMVLRMENIFDEVESRLQHMDDMDGDNAVADLLSEFSSEIEDSSEHRFRYMSKPVVIGDSIPPPLNCPTPVQHVRGWEYMIRDTLVAIVVCLCVCVCVCCLVFTITYVYISLYKESICVFCLQSLEAALAHHNLGSYEESLKYLETARIQLVEGEREKLLARKRAELTKQLLKDVPLDAKGEPLEPIVLPAVEVQDSEIVIPSDCRFYIMACKGNVYQSCGDDEQSLLQYMKGWEIASNDMHKDWEVLFINSVGLLAYYNLHYELAWRCFARVSYFREMVSYIMRLLL